MRKLIAAVAVGLIVFVAGTAVGLRLAREPEVAVQPDQGELVLTAALQPFDDCEALVTHYREAALAMVGPYGLQGAGVLAEGDAMAAQEGAEDSAVAAPGAAERAVGPGETGTNVQEAGVDEPDLVKTDGELILAVASGRLQVVEAGTSPRVIATLGLPDGWQHELLIDGDRALVLTRGQGVVVPMQDTREDASSFVPSTGSVLTAVDLSDPSEPRVEATLTLDGEYRSARVVDGVARIVIAAQPTALPFTAPTTGGLRAEREALERNRQVIEEAEASDWLPWSVLSDGDGNVVREGPLLECADVRRPPGFTGLGTLSVLTIDLSAGLEARSAMGITAQGETVYASADRLYVATTDWGEPRPLDFQRSVPPSEIAGTSIHAFDITDPARADYVGSGAVDGTLLNSYAMSAEGGFLRVATTSQPMFGGGEVPASESSVIVLEERGEALEEVGRLDGLGETETIRGVRFLGDLAAVVTFRQTDPLYIIDLSDPAGPALLGELKVPGYSAYLHPVGDDRLLGIGQDGTEDGQLLGVQASLFDLSDRSNPTRLDAVDLGAYYSEVESDPRAFLYWPDQSLAVVPVQSEQAGGAAAGVRVEGDSLERVTIAAPAGGASGAPVRRALVVGDLLYTISETGVQASDLATLEPAGSVAFR